MGDSVGVTTTETGVAVGNETAETGGGGGGGGGAAAAGEEGGGVPGYAWHDPAGDPSYSRQMSGRTTGRNGALHLKSGVAQVEFVRSSRGARQRAVLDQQFYDLAANPPIAQRPDTRFGVVPGMLLTGSGSRSIIVPTPATLYAQPAQRFSMIQPTAVVNPAREASRTAETVAESLGYGHTTNGRRKTANNLADQKSARDELAAKSMGLAVVGQRRHALADAKLAEKERRKSLMSSARERSMAAFPGATTGLVNSVSKTVAATQFYEAALKAPQNIPGQLATNAAYRPVRPGYSRT